MKSYEKVGNVRRNTKVVIHCQKHGDFETTFRYLLGGQGCFVCWQERYAQLFAYADERNTALVPKSHKTADGDRLGNWVSKQRSKWDSLSSARQEKLNALQGWVLDAREAQWQKGYAQLAAYADEHNTANVPSSYETADGYGLGRWVAKQRQGGGSLSEERQQTLNGLQGWALDAREAQWQEHYAQLVAYADGMVVGATRIVDTDMPIVLAAWGGYHEYGVNLPGYDTGDSIELRLYSLSEGRELYVQSDLEGSEYGVTPITSGTGIVLSSDAVPMAYDLMQNYPNPFNPSTSIGFTLPEAGHVSLNIYDMTGRLVTTLVEGNLTEGVHMVDWNGLDSSGSMVSAGVYFYTLESSDMMMTKKMILMK